MIDSVRFLLKRNFAIRVYKCRGYEQSLEKGWQLVQTQILIFSPKNNIWKHIFPIFPNFHMFGEFLMEVWNLWGVFWDTLYIERGAIIVWSKIYHFSFDFVQGVPKKTPQRFQTSMTNSPILWNFLKIGKMCFHMLFLRENIKTGVWANFHRFFSDCS